jgi:hypothetical protein
MDGAGSIDHSKPLGAFLDSKEAKDVGAYGEISGKGVTDLSAVLDGSAKSCNAIAGEILRELGSSGDPYGEPVAAAFLSYTARVHTLSAMESSEDSVDSQSSEFSAKDAEAFFHAMSGTGRAAVTNEAFSSVDSDSSMATRERMEGFGHDQRSIETNRAASLLTNDASPSVKVDRSKLEKEIKTRNFVVGEIISKEERLLERLEALQSIVSGECWGEAVDDAVKEIASVVGESYSDPRLDKEVIKERKTERKKGKREKDKVRLENKEKEMEVREDFKGKTKKEQKAFFKEFAAGLKMEPIDIGKKETRKIKEQGELAAKKRGLLKAKMGPTAMKQELGPLAMDLSRADGTKATKDSKYVRKQSSEIKDMAISQLFEKEFGAHIKAGTLEDELSKILKPKVQDHMGGFIDKLNEAVASQTDFVETMNGVSESLEGLEGGEKLLEGIKGVGNAFNKAVNGEHGRKLTELFEAGKPGSHTDSGFVSDEGMELVMNQAGKLLESNVGSRYSIPGEYGTEENASKTRDMSKVSAFPNPVSVLMNITDAMSMLKTLSKPLKRGPASDDLTAAFNSLKETTVSSLGKVCSSFQRLEEEMTLKD